MQNFKDISKMNLRIRTHTFRTQDKMHAILLLQGIMHQPAADRLRFLVQWSICDCGAVQSAVCLSDCLTAAAIFLLRTKQNGGLRLCKICAEIIVHRMFAVSLNGLNGKNSSRSIVQNIFFFGLFVLF